MARFVTKIIATDRINTCKECTSKKTAKFISICSECNCPIVGKAIMAEQTCPLGKWKE